MAPGDLSIYFGHQRDPVAARMAAFNEADPDDRAPLDAHWARVVAEDATSDSPTRGENIPEAIGPPGMRGRRPARPVPREGILRSSLPLLERRPC